MENVYYDEYSNVKKSIMKKYLMYLYNCLVVDSM